MRYQIFFSRCSFQLYMYIFYCRVIHFSLYFSPLSLQCLVFLIYFIFFWRILKIVIVFVVEKILVAFSLTLFWYGNLLKFQFLLWKREKEKEISQDDRIVDILLSMNNWRNNPWKRNLYRMHPLLYIANRVAVKHISTKFWRKWPPQLIHDRPLNWP